MALVNESGDSGSYSGGYTLPTEHRVQTEWNPDVGAFAVYEPDGFGGYVFSGWRAPSSSGGGSGGSGGVDHFFDVSPVDQWQIDTDKRDFDYGVGRDAVEDRRWQTEFDYGVGRDAANDAFRNRSLDMENQWRSEGFAVDREGIAQRAAAAQMDFQASMARIQVEAQNAQNQYQIGMANATNDAERNQIQAWWNQKQAELAVMEDQTRRELGFQQNQIAQFGAETDRAVGMGNLALDNNKFIAEMARSPRDLFGLFMMQRGVTPDWDTMAAGGTPAQGEAIVPVNPMNAYKPTTQPVQFGAGAPANPARPTGGAYTPGANPWLSGGGGGGAVTVPQAAPRPSNTVSQPAPRATRPTSPTDNRWGSGTYQDPHGSTPTNVEGGDEWMSYSGVPSSQVSGLTSGQMQLVTTGGAGTSKVGDYTDYRVGIGAGQWIEDPNYVIEPGRSVWLQRKAGGGPTRAPALMTGDSPLPNPSAGGARPEVIFNPTQAPLWVQPNPRSFQDLRRADQRKRPTQQVWDYMGRANANRGLSPAMGHNYYKQQWAGDFGGPTRSGVFVPQPKPQAPTAWAGFAPNGIHAGMANQPIPRFALGTQGAYEATGMGSLYLPSSTNEHLQNADLPTRLKMLADYGMPLSPSLVASATGGTAPTLNMGSAVTEGRKAGVLPSLQTLGRQTKSETEHTRGYFEGVAGVPWADIVDWLGKPTEFLQQAQRSRGY